MGSEHVVNGEGDRKMVATAWALETAAAAQVSHGGPPAAALRSPRERGAPGSD